MAQDTRSINLNEQPRRVEHRGDQVIRINPDGSEEDVTDEFNKLMGEMGFEPKSTGLDYPALMSRDRPEKMKHMIGGVADTVPFVTREHLDAVNIPVALDEPDWAEERVFEKVGEGLGLGATTLAAIPMAKAAAGTRLAAGAGKVLGPTLSRVTPPAVKKVLDKVGAFGSQAAKDATDRPVRFLASELGAATAAATVDEEVGDEWYGLPLSVGAGGVGGVGPYVPGVSGGITLLDTLIRPSRYRGAARNLKEFIQHPIETTRGAMDDWSVRQAQRALEGQPRGTSRNPFTPSIIGETPQGVPVIDPRSPAFKRVAHRLQSIDPNRPVKPRISDGKYSRFMTHREREAAYNDDLLQWKEDQGRYADKMFSDLFVLDEATGRKIVRGDNPLLTVAQATGQPNIIAEANFVQARLQNNLPAMQRAEENARTAIQRYVDSDPVGNPSLRLAELQETMNDILRESRRTLDRAPYTHEDLGGRASQTASGSIGDAVANIREVESGLWGGFRGATGSRGHQQIGDLHQAIDNYYTSLDPFEQKNWPSAILGTRSISPEGDVVWKGAGAAMNLWSPESMLKNGFDIPADSARSLHSVYSQLRELKREFPKKTRLGHHAQEVADIIMNKLESLAAANQDIQRLTEARSYTREFQDLLDNEVVSNLVVRKPGQGESLVARAPQVFFDTAKLTGPNGTIRKQVLDDLFELSSLGRGGAGPDPNLVAATREHILERFGESSRTSAGSQVLTDLDAAQRFLRENGRVLSHDALTGTRQDIVRMIGEISDTHRNATVQEAMSRVWKNAGSDGANLRVNLNGMKKDFGPGGVYAGMVKPEEQSVLFRRALLQEKMYHPTTSAGQGRLRDDAFDTIYKELQNPNSRRVYEEIFDDPEELKRFEGTVRLAIGPEISLRGGDLTITPGEIDDPPAIKRLMDLARLASRFAGARAGGGLGGTIGGSMQTAGTMTKASERTVMDIMDREYWKLIEVAFEYPELYEQLARADVSDLQETLNLASVLGGWSFSHLKSLAARAFVPTAMGTGIALSPEEEPQGSSIEIQSLQAPPPGAPRE